jgi:2,4-dienoyl-CoA reductase-like NADH-dependent reductase (Old Yellow Enzyme family)
MVMRNRFVRSATWEGLADPAGCATGELARLYAEFARGKVGLVISSHAFVSPEGRAGTQQLGAHDDSVIPGLARLASAVHEAEGKVALQVAHAGLWAQPDTVGDEAAQPLGPSVLQTESGPVGREMSLGDIAVVTQAFAAAAGRAQAAGLDAVQIHAAHGYLLSEFLSPAFNHRTDAYGGDVAGRARLVVEVIAAVRAVVGPDYPVLIKVNSEDFIPGGLTADQMLESALLMVEAGVDAIELSGGTSLSGDLGPIRTRAGIPVEREAYYEEAARRLKQTVTVPVVLVGGIRSLAAAETLVTSGCADCIALSRPLIRDPHLIARWESGEQAPSACRSDNRCYYKGLKREGMHCVHVAKAEEGDW